MGREKGKEGKALYCTVQYSKEGAGTVSRSLLNQRLAAGTASAGPVGGDKIA